MILDHLPPRTGSAPENMAQDFLLLQRHPHPDHARLRHYGWRNPACTFGYSQKIADVRARLPGGINELCRRPTGGGIVDHRDDWTFALVVPRGHPVAGERAQQSYRGLHECVARVLAAQGVPAEVRTSIDSAEGPAGVCFERAELYDVVRTDTGAKIAGAAQKRNQRGLLFQGSISRAQAGAGVDWDRFEAEFAADVAAWLGAEVAEPGWPDIDWEEESGLTERYASAEWNEMR